MPEVIRITRVTLRDGPTTTLPPTSNSCGRYPINGDPQQSERWQWSPNLSFMSQHVHFYGGVQSIPDQARMFNDLFCASQHEISAIRDANRQLLDRDRIRSSTERVLGYGAEDHTSGYDISYLSRDRDDQSPRYNNTFILSSHIYRGRRTFHWGIPRASTTWELLSQSPSISGYNHHLDLAHVKYGCFKRSKLSRS